MRVSHNPATLIPPERRREVEERDTWCVRCGGVRALAWHHRRGRSVVDEHRHCACNGILLCTTCHRWVHANPEASRERGLIVNREMPVPGRVPVKCLDGWWLNLCNGDAVSLQPDRVLRIENDPAISQSMAEFYEWTGPSS